MALEGAYAFDDIGAATIADLSGNGRDIDLTGHPGAQVAGMDTGAFGKTGAGTISLPAALRTACETDDRTIMCDVLGARQVWIARFESTSLDTGIFGLLSLDSANAIGRARTQANVGPSATPALGAIGTPRHHLALRYVRSTGIVTPFYDGVPGTNVTFTAGTQLYVGADDLNIAEWDTTGAAIDNLRFFSHALTDAEILELATTPVTGGPAPVEEAEFEVALELDVAPEGSVPPVIVPEAEFEIPLQVDAEFAATTPTATVPAAALIIPLAVSVVFAGTLEQPTVLGGWESLLDTMRWNAAEYQRERETDPVACPQHGDPLDQHNGKLHCPMGHFVSGA